MPTLPPAMLPLVTAFAPLFSRRVWPRALVLLGGAILAPGRRTVAAAVRVMGLEQEPRFERYHRVLNRARWSSLAASRVLLGLLVRVLVPSGPLLMGIDETLERRWGAKIAARGIDRDAVRSSQSHVVKASGLRWVCVMLLVPIAWAERVWALPFLTALAPSERSDRERGRRHTTLTDWARQMLLVVRRWWPDRSLVAVADSTDAALEFLAACRGWSNPVTVVTRLRLDAALDAPAPPREPGQKGRPRLKGERLPPLAAVAASAATAWTPATIADWYGEGPRVVEIVSRTAVWQHGGLPVVPLPPNRFAGGVLIRDPEGSFDTQALLCTDPDAAPEQILAWFVQRWQLEVTFEKVRRHLGVETQRQWSDLAILRTTPALLGLFSLVTLFAQQRVAGPTATIRQAAWYPKALPTFVDALALLRRELWTHQAFSLSGPAPDLIQVPRVFVEHLTETLCYAA